MCRLNSYPIESEGEGERKGREGVNEGRGGERERRGSRRGRVMETEGRGGRRIGMNYNTSPSNTMYFFLRESTNARRFSISFSLGISVE